MNIYIPYTYLIGWTTHNKWYYGVRYSKKCHPKDFWKTYFTSSKQVKKFRKEYGEPDIIQIRRTFKDSKTARLWEHKVLRRLNASIREDFLNQTDSLSLPHYSGANHPMFGRDRSGSNNPRFGAILSEETRKLISKNHHDVSGPNNPRAIDWKLTSPKGLVYIIKGNLQEFANRHNLSHRLMLKHLGSIVPVPSRHATNFKYTETVGWKLEKINSK